ncbi:MAG TPA: hypothetical protein VHH11_00945, partial [Gammaproteobacteria bacterium]|nr:hypothetical protein [Gammaproteobacteria bacterium]
MKNDKNAHGDDYQVDDAATGEYPVLFDAVGEPTSPLPAQNGAAHDVTVESLRPPAGEEAQVSGWLADLEAEIARLHDRWQQVEQGFSAKDSLIAGMKQEIATRDSTLAELHTRLERNADALKSLERSLADKTAEATHLSAEVARHVAAHEQDAAALAATAAAREAVQRDLDAARADIARLNADVSREQAAVQALASRNEQLMAAQATMTLRIQELETYIDGRAQSWSGLKQEIAEQKSTIARLEKGLKTKDAAIEDAARARRELDQKLVELERLNLELTGRRKEREDAYEELQRKLAGHFALAEQLKADLAKRAGEHDRLLASATADRALLATLETAVRDKDAALDSLRAELAAERAAADERLRAIERALTERDAALAQSREQAEQQTALAAKLAAELDVKRSSVDLLQRNVQRITN